MNKKKVVVIGAGFAGISAVGYLSSYKHLIDCTLVDKYENCHLKALYPDVISSTVSAQNLLYPIVNFKDSLGFSFVCQNVTDIQFTEQFITTPDHTIPFDYLIIATGSQTSFPPVFLKGPTVRFDTVHDANMVKDKVLSGEYRNVVVCGGGYTGIEVASHLQKLINDHKLYMHVTVVEMVDRLISTLPVWMQHYTINNLSEMGIEIRLSTKVESVDGREVILSDGNHINGALCIWTAGLVGPDLTRNLDVEKLEKGRLKADQYLKISENCFSAGDTCCPVMNGNCTRMSVQNAIDQGKLAATNCVALIKNTILKKYNYFDPGFIVPMANGKSCGEVYSFRVKGKIATTLHYLLSIYRSYGLYNRIVILQGTSHIFFNKK
jgi:NADH dehydrogenase